MARVESQYAKLTRPRLHGAVIRAQLFSTMDQARARPSDPLSGTSRRWQDDTANVLVGC